MMSILSMNKLQVYLLLAGILILAAANKSIAQNGWVKKKGEIYSKLYVLNGKSDQYYTLDGTKTTTNEFSQITGGLHFEYGISDNLTLLANWPIIKHQYFTNTERISGIGDLPIGLKYGVLKGNSPVSISFSAELPIAKRDNFARNKEQTAFVDQINLPTGDGEWNFLTTVAASHAFNKAPFPIFISIYSTFNYRTGFRGIDFSNQLKSGLSMGANVFDKKVWLEVSIVAQQSLGESKQVDFVRGEGTEFTSYSASATVILNEHWGVNISYFNYSDLITDRVNLYSAGIISLGVSYELKK